MKLLICKACSDIFNLSKERKFCRCKKSWGQYLEDGYLAIYGGSKAVPIGFANSSLIDAIKHRPKKADRGEVFTAFTVPESSSTFIRVGNKEKKIHSGILCPSCNDKIFSYHRHDFKSCKCKGCFVDGGFDYQRSGGGTFITIVASKKEVYYMAYKLENRQFIPDKRI
jgi:hypothetical protein